MIIVAISPACDCGSSDDNSGKANPSDDDSGVDDDSMVDDDLDDDADDDSSTTTTSVPTTTTTTSPSGSSTTTTTTVVTTTSTSTTTTTIRPGSGTACDPYNKVPEVIEREKPYGPWPEFEERGITFRQIISSGAGQGQNDILFTSDGLARVAAQDGRSLDVIAVGPAGEVSRDVVDPRGGEWKVLGKDAEDHLYLLYTVHVDQLPETWELRAATNKSGAWVRETLFTSHDDATLSFDMAVDAAGLMHIVFTGRDESAVAYYATWDGDTYTETQIAASPGGWRYIYALALDSTGSPHVLFSESTGVWHWRIEDNVWTGDLANGNAFAWDLEIDANDVLHAGLSANGGHLVYGKFESGVWTFVDLDDCQDGVSFISVNVDGDGHVHIAYTDGNQNDVLYATNASGAWVHTFLYEEIDTEDADFGHAWDMASALDAIDKIHIVHRRYNDYYYSRDSDLNLTTNETGDWVRRRLIKGSLRFYEPGVLDEYDRLHISFTRNHNTQLIYGLLDGDVWMEEKVDEIGVDVSQISSPILQMDSFGDVYISYAYGFSSDLRRRNIANKHDGEWSYNSIGVDADGFSDTLFAIDRNDNQHIAHIRIEDTINIAEYGIKNSTEWNIETLEGIRFLESIVVNSDGHPLVAYKLRSDYEETVHVTLRESDGTWIDELVDSASVPLYTGFSSAIGTDDVVRLGYMFQNDYRFASNVAGLWSVEALEMGESSRSDIKLTLDAENSPHIILFAYNGALAPEGPGIYYMHKFDESWERLFIDGYIGDMHPYGIHVRSDGKITGYYNYYGGQALITATFEPSIE